MLHFSPKSATQNPDYNHYKVENLYPTAQPFWFAAQDAYFDVRVFHPNVVYSATAPEPSKLPTRNMRMKINGLTANASETMSKEFSPPSVVFSTTGGLGQEATTFYTKD